MPHTKSAVHKEATSDHPKGTILLVDDEDMLRSALKRTIRVIGQKDKMELAVVSVGSVEVAMQIIQGGLNPDVIFSDMMMPEATGQDFLERLEKEYPALVSRFCFVSGGGLSQGHQELLEYMKKIDRMIEKPFEMHQIRDVIRSILGLK